MIDQCGDHFLIFVEELLQTFSIVLVIITLIRTRFTVVAGDRVILDNDTRNRRPTLDTLTSNKTITFLSSDSIT